MRADDENEIRRVLRTEARPQPMSADEHARILARLQRADTASRPATEYADVAGTVPLASADQGYERRNAGVRSILVGCTAAALIVALGAGLLAVGSEPDVGPAATTSERRPPCPDEWNAAHVVPLADAVDQWRTVDNWAFTQGEPDLGALSASALEAASTLSDSQQRNRATVSLDALTASLSSIDDTSIVDSLTAAQTRIDAVEQAIATVNEISQSFDDSCEFRLVDAEP